ncbi:ArfGap-domain-containing protein [Neoconidiobolus thromboides FSU 785]|nr:ArfGap-domain-containing protein [Neoconidiobolus thromboides FSU 785]
MASLSSKEAKKQQEINERKLLTLVKQPGNSACCDCGANGPRWASFNIGCFLCIRCGGIHRRMGTHISKVKSISLDSWKDDQIENMEKWGNTKVNELYLYQAKSRPVPNDDDGMEQYIRDKYEKKRFFKPGGQVIEIYSAVLLLLIYR